MKYRLYAYTRRHAAFLLIDLITFVLGYALSILIRSMIYVPIYRGDLILKYGFVAWAIYAVIEFSTQNLNGILFRGLTREIQAVAVQMGVSWSVFTVILYLFKEAHEYSRSTYLVAFVICFLCILGARSVAKMLFRYSRLHEQKAPSLLVVCESARAQTVLNRLLPGSFKNYYQIKGLVLNGKGQADYRDWYPHTEGLDHLADWLSDNRILDAYVELDDPKEEETAIRQLLNAGVTVHRSLGDSNIEYLSQRVNKIADKSVITIEDPRSSISGRLDGWTRAYREKKTTPVSKT